MACMRSPIDASRLWSTCFKRLVLGACRQRSYFDVLGLQVLIPPGAGPDLASICRAALLYPFFSSAALCAVSV